MKKHNLLKVILIAIVATFLLTWILPTISVQYGEVVEGARQQLGLTDFMTYLSLNVSYFGVLFVFILVVGAFYGVLSKTGAYRSLLDKIVKGFEGKEHLFLAVTMIFIAAVTSISGLNYAMIVLFPLVISVILLMGYHKLTAATVVVGSLLVGMMGTTYGTPNIPYFADILGTTPQTEIYTKILILLVGIVLLVFQVLHFAKKDKAEVKVLNEYVPKDEKEKKPVWPIVVIFDLLLLVMVLSSIPWNSVFEVTLFEDVTKWINEFVISDFPIFAKLFGTLTPFGTWEIQQMTIVIFVATVVLGISYKQSFDDFIQHLLDGMKKAVKPAAIVMVLYTVLLIATYHPFQLTIAKFLLELSSKFNVVTMGLVATVASFFNIDATYVAQSTLPYVTTIITDQTVYPLIGIIFQSIYAFVMLFAPTSVVLMGTLSYLDIPYQDWLKHIWKLLLELLVVLFIIFTIILLV